MSSFLLYIGASIGLQINEDIELEGSYAMGSSLQERVAIIEQRELTASQRLQSFGGRLRYYIGDIWNLGVGFRYLTISEAKSP